MPAGHRGLVFPGASPDLGLVRPRIFIPGGIAAAVPITVTFTITTDAGDSSGYYSHTAYPPQTSGGYTVFTPSVWIARSLIGATYYTSNGYFRFDTSSIPDTATITAATLRVYQESITVNNDDSRSITGDWYDFGGTDTSADWADTGTAAFAAIGISTLNGVGDKDISLLNPDANVNKSGFTGIRTHITGGQPTGNNDVYLAANEHASNPAARLLVTYTP